MFHGSMVAIVTPMKPNGEVDFDRFNDLLEWHIESKTNAIVVLGTTGESPTIDLGERTAIIKNAIKRVAGRVPVIVGTGVYCTRETIHLTKQAMELGADACLIVTPYYNKPTQAGLIAHFRAVAEAVAIPQILYNVPGRTGVDMLPQTVATLAKIPNIVGIKEASGDVKRVKEILELSHGNIELYTGVDENTLDFIVAGGKGAISVTANLAPRQMHNMCDAALKGKIDEAKKIDAKLMELHKKLFIEANPIPVKWGLHELGKIDTGIRLPLTALSEDKRTIIRDAMHHAELI